MTAIQIALAYYVVGVAYMTVELQAHPKARGVRVAVFVFTLLFFWAIWPLFLFVAVMAGGTRQ